MELKTDDVMKLVNDNHERSLSQERINEVMHIVNTNHERSLKQQKKLIEKNQKVEKVKKGAIMLGLGFVLGIAPTAKVISDGQNEIVCEFDNATSEYGIRQYSTGYQINYGTTYVDFEDGINGMIDAARENGMNDTEIAIGLNSIISNQETRSFIDTTFSERCNECMHRYTEKKLSGEYKNGK